MPKAVRSDRKSFRMTLASITILVMCVLGPAPSQIHAMPMGGGGGMAMPPPPPNIPPPDVGGMGHQVDPGRVMSTNECTPNQMRRAKKGQRCYVNRVTPKQKAVTCKALPSVKKSTVSKSSRRATARIVQALPANEPNEVLAVFPGQASDQAINEVAGQYRLTRLGYSLIEALSLKVVRFSVSGGRALPDIVTALQNDTRITDAQLNHVYQTAASGTQGYAARLLHLGDAHEISGGKDVLVAVIDTAIDQDHPALKGVIRASFDAFGDANIKPDSHGTVIAGIIAGQGKITGVAPAAKLLTACAFKTSKNGRFRSSNTFLLLKSVDWAISNGANVVNLSFAGPRDPLFERILSTATEKNIFMIASVGNDGPDAQPAYPAAYDSVIAVTAVDYNKVLFPKAVRGAHVSISAPGVRILSAKPHGKYGYLTGTSMAAAHVSGVAALMLEKNPALGIDELRNRLSDTAVDLGAPGKDTLYGYGLVDALAALKALSSVGPDTTQLLRLKPN